MGLFPKREPEEDGKKFSQDHSNRLPLDVVLRKNGFKIKSRQNKTQAIWEKDGEDFSQDQALKLCPRKEVQCALELADDEDSDVFQTASR